MNILILIDQIYRLKLRLFRDRIVEGVQKLNDSNYVRLLLIEDSEDHRFLLKHELESSTVKFEIVEAGRGIEAEQIILQHPFTFDIVILDYNLPDKSGLELLNQIRTTGKDVEVIITTGMGSERVAVDALRLHVNDYIIKEGNFAVQVAKAVLYSYERLKLKRALQEKEELLRISELKYRTLIENANDGIIVIDENECITDANAYMTKLTRYSKETLLKKHYLELFTGQELISRQLSQIVRDGSGKIIDANLQTADKKILSVQISFTAVKVPEVSFFAIMIIRDMTQNRNLEKILKEQTDRLESLLLNREVNKTIYK